MIGMMLAATITLTSPFGTAEVATYGAVMKSWKPKDSSDVFAMARPYETCDPEDQIHGGFPLCWPWAVYEGEKGCKIHGITRYNEWKVAAQTADSVTLALEDSEKTRKIWPYAFRAELTYRLGRELSVAFRVVNRDTRPFTCTELFHPYFRVGDTLKCSVTGTDGVPYFWEPEAEKGGKRKWSGDFSGVLVKDGAPGYVFEEGPHTHLLKDPVLGRTLKVSYEGNPKFVIWGSANDFKEYGGAEDPNFGRTFICVEGGNIYRDCAYTLKPGETHELKARIEVCPDACGGTGLLSPEVGLGWENGWVKEWTREIPGLEIRDTRTPVSDGLVKIVRRWTWKGEKPLEKVVLSVRYRMAGDATRQRPFIPSVLLYGNPSNWKNYYENRGQKRFETVAVYKGLAGEFGIFEEHRLPMPFACVEDEQAQTFAALHPVPSPVLGAVHSDQWWSAGVESRGDATDIVLLSGPVGFNGRRSVVKGRMNRALPYDDAYLTLHPGQVIEKTFYVQTGAVTPAAFGFEQAVGASLAIWKPECAAGRYKTMDEIARMKRGYALTRWVEDAKRGVYGFNKYGPDFIRRSISLGWVGCCETCGYALPVLDFAADDWEKAQKSLDFICDTFAPTLAQNGLFCQAYDIRSGQVARHMSLVNSGQALNTILRAIRFAEKSGGRLDATKWKAFAKESTDRIAAAIVHPRWNKPATANHSFLVAPLVRAGEMFGNADCLAAARRLAEAHEELFLGYGKVYDGGTLDAGCEDKEGAYGVFQGCVELMRVAQEKGDDAARRRWERLARHSFANMISYMFAWDIPMPPGRLADQGFRTTGWSVVSPQNQCTDIFLVLASPEVWRFGEMTGEPRYKSLAELMYRACGQLMKENGEQGEQILHTNYVHLERVPKGADYSGIVWPEDNPKNIQVRRGYYEETWVPFWICAHFLNAAAQFKEMGAYGRR